MRQSAPKPLRELATAISISSARPKIHISRLNGSRSFVCFPCLRNGTRKRGSASDRFGGNGTSECTVSARSTGSAPKFWGGRFRGLRREMLVRGKDAGGLAPARNPQCARRFLQIAIDREGREPKRKGDFLGRHAARDEPQAIAFARCELIDRPGHHRCQLLAIARANPTELVRFSAVSVVKGE